MALGVALTAISTGVERRVVAVHPTVMGCEHGCEVVAAGWPVPFVVDNPALSPVNSVSLLMALDGGDEVRWGGLAATLGFWLAVSVGAIGLAQRAAGRRRAPGTRRRASGERDG